MKITIGHLYPDLLNLYGDRGNIAALVRRLNLRGIETEVIKYEIDEKIDFENMDIILLGGGSDREEVIVNEKLKQHKDELLNYVNNDKTLIALCGGYHILGKYFTIENKKIEGLGVLDIYTEQKENRLIGNVILKSDIINSTIVGFENHNGRTYINNHTPLGSVMVGFGNNSKDGMEGVIYKNVIGTNLHGPLLPKNPLLADYIIEKTLTKKYGKSSLNKLDDTLENNAHNYILKRFLK